MGPVTLNFCRRVRAGQDAIAINDQRQSVGVPRFPGTTELVREWISPGTTEGRAAARAEQLDAAILSDTPEWAGALDDARNAQREAYLRRRTIVGSAFDRVSLLRGGPGFGNARRLREAEAELESARRTALTGYVNDAAAVWRSTNEKAPTWMLPVVSELPCPNRLAPGIRLYPSPEFMDHAVAQMRCAAQPPLTTGPASFPSSARVRDPSHFSIPGLDEQALDVFEKWFTSPGQWRDYASDLELLTRRRLSSNGLVWRQHKVRPEVDGTDLRIAEPGTRFELPYPASCRSLPNPMGSICRPLNRRSDYLAGASEDVVYLEIWASWGAALPGRPNSNQNENEVLLPAGSVYRVVRHVDLPYIEQLAYDSPATSAHGIQLVQIFEA